MVTGYFNGAKGHKGESDHTAGLKDSLDDASDDGSDVNAAAPHHHLVDGHELAEDQHDADLPDSESTGSPSSESDDSIVPSDASDSGSEPDDQHDAAPLHDGLPLHTLLRWPSSNDDLLRETFGSDHKRWPSRADDARVVTFVLHQLYDPSKFDYHNQALRTKSGVAINNRIDLARFCNESVDSELLTRFDLACTSCIQNLDRLRPKQQPQSPVSQLELDVDFHLDESISASLSQNDLGNAKNPKGKVKLVQFDAIQPRGKFQVKLRIRGGTIVKARQTLLAEECIPPNIKAQIAALPKHTTSKWTQLVGDKSKHEEGDPYDSLPSERVRCLPYALMDVIGYPKRMESKLFRGESKGSLNVCDIRYFSNVVKRKLNINLEHLKLRAVASDPTSHKHPNESWLTFFARQATGKYLLIDCGHAKGIDCENKVVWHGSRQVSGLELLTILDEKRAYARKIVYQGD
jgi:hypothetical protein